MELIVPIVSIVSIVSIVFMVSMASMVLMVSMVVMFFFFSIGVLFCVQYQFFSFFCFDGVEMIALLGGVFHLWPLEGCGAAYV